MGPDTPAPNVLKKALKQVLALFLPETERPRIFSYKDDFGTLWQIPDKNNTVSEITGSTICIIWDGLPKREMDLLVNVEKFLTPIDWSVGFSLQAVNKKQNSGSSNNACPKLRILILNVFPQSIIDSHGSRLFKNCSALLPWIHVLGATDVASTSWPDGSFMPFLLNRLKNTTTLADSASDKSNMELVKGIWSSNILQDPGDHHAISNLTGPLLLIGDRKGDAQVHALKNMMHWIGLLPKPSPDSQMLEIKKPWIDWSKEPWKAKLDRVKRHGSEPLNVVLLDDFAFRHGWAEFLCKAIAPDDSLTGVQLPSPDDEHSKIHLKHNELSINVFSFSSPTELLRKLGLCPGNYEASENHNTDHRFSLRLRWNESEIYPLDILFLDLRLFQNKETGLLTESEKGFYDILLNNIEFFHLFGESEDNPRLNDVNQQLPWPGIIANELGNIADWSNAVTEKTGREKSENESHQIEDSSHHMALTLLPRFISLIDYSLPIILFSSTGRREIVEKFKQYGNIITDFEKPRISSSMSRYIVDETAEKFKKAFSAALDLVVSRRFCSKLLNTNIETHSDSAWSKYNHFEIYIDESSTAEKKYFCCGGLMVGYENENDSDIVHNQMQKNSPQPIVWCGPINPHQKLLDKRFEDKSLPKESIFDEASIKMKNLVADPLVAILGDRPLVPFVLFRHPNPKPLKDPTDLLSPDAIDNMYLDLLRYALEIMTFEMIPLIKGNDNNVTVSIFVATRQRSNDKWSDTNWEDLFSKFGIFASIMGQQKIMLRHKRDDRIVSYDEFNWAKTDVKLITQKGKMKRDLADTQFMSGDPEIHYQSIRSDSIYPIIVEILIRRDQSNLKPEIKRSLGITYKYDDDKIPHPNFRHMHYVADLIANRAQRDNFNDRDITIHVFEDWEPAKNTGLTIKEISDEQFKYILDASRRIEADDLVGALLRISNIEPRNYSKTVLNRIILSKIRQGLIKKLDGNEFLRFSNLHEATFGIPLSVLPSPVNIRHKKSINKTPSIKKTIVPTISPAIITGNSVVIDKIEKYGEPLAAMVKVIYPDKNAFYALTFESPSIPVHVNVRPDQYMPRKSETVTVQLVKYDGRLKSKSGKCFNAILL